MKYSTGRKKRSRLQGHRRRRRTPEALKINAAEVLSFAEYKTLRQYRSMGETLDEFRLYGYRAGMRSLSDKYCDAAGEAHGWLTMEPDPGDYSQGGSD